VCEPLALRSLIASDHGAASSPSQWNVLRDRGTTITAGANRPVGFLKQIEEWFDDVDRHREYDCGVAFGADLSRTIFWM
jgi:hypothetical protein